MTPAAATGAGAGAGAGACAGAEEEEDEDEPLTRLTKLTGGGETGLGAAMTADGDDDEEEDDEDTLATNGDGPALNRPTGVGGEKTAAAWWEQAEFWQVPLLALL